MKLRMILTGLLLCLVHAVAEANPEQLDMQQFTILPSIAERVNESSIDQWKGLFGQNGVDWPDGSSIEFRQLSNTLVVKNTRANLNLMERLMLILQVIPFLIEVQVDCIEYKMTDVDEIARTGELSASTLLAFWRKGGAKLLYTPRVMTESGVEAVVKGVTEYIYPTEFTVSTRTSTNSSDLPVSATVVEPSAFQVRDVGVILRCVPRLSPGGEMITIHFEQEFLQISDWMNYGSRYEGPDGQKVEIPMELPFFHTLSSVNSVTVANGATVLIAGGMNNNVGDKTVFTFVTARLVDMKGNPIITEAETGEQANAAYRR